MKTSSLPGNKIGETKLGFDVSRQIDKVMRKPPPITESQQELLDHLKKCLDDAGIYYGFLIEPQDSKTASHVINALIRLGKRHNVDTGRGSKPVGET